MLILLNKVKNIVDGIPIHEWPSNLLINRDFNGKVSSLEVNLSRCKIFISNYSSNNSIRVEFKVGISAIIGTYHVSRFRAPFSKVYRLWKSICKRIEFNNASFHEALVKKQANEQREIFNELYYTQFPEDIDNIILGDDDD